jgi:ribosomal protein L18E
LTQFGRYVKGKTTNIGKSGQERKKADGTTVVIGDVSGDGAINSSDLTQFGRYVKGKTTNIGKSGQEVEVLDESAK